MGRARQCRYVCDCGMDYQRCALRELLLHLPGRYYQLELEEIAARGYTKVTGWPLGR